VLHPDEVHDGGAGDETGLSYRMLYVEPALIAGPMGGADREVATVSAGALIPIARPRSQL
jgi:hypothetical protein